MDEKKSKHDEDDESQEDEDQESGRMESYSNEKNDHVDELG